MGKKKKVLKDKKLQSIREANIIVDIRFSEKLGEYYLYLEVNRIIEPSVRPRTSSRFSGMYDPLANYKKVIENKINEYLALNNYVFIPYIGSCRSVIRIYKKPKKTLSLKDRFLYILYKTPVLVKPDIDNVEKTIWDIFNGIIIKDDNQIYSSKTIKRYGEHDKTIVKLYFEKENVCFKEYTKKRLSKEDSEYIKLLYEEDIDEE